MLKQMIKVQGATHKNVNCIHRSLHVYSQKFACIYNHIYVSVSLHMDVYKD